MRTLPDKTIFNFLLNEEVLQIKVDILEAGRKPILDDAWRVANLFSVRCRRRYTILRVCRLWGMSRATVYRRRKRAAPPLPAVAYRDEEIADKLREIIAQSVFPAERHRKLWARLCRKGIQSHANALENCRT